MTCTTNNHASDKRYEAFHTYQKWLEGCASTYLRQKYQSVGDQPAAFERWYYDAAKIILVPAELHESSLTKGQSKRISSAAKALAEPSMWNNLLAKVNDMSATAKLAKQLGLKEKDIPMLVALTATAVATAAQKQVKACGAECPYSHALGCLIGGTCTRPAGHSGLHKDGRSHSWG